MIASLSKLALVGLFTATMTSAAAPIRNIMYLTGQHPFVPDSTTSSPITHVAMAFMSPSFFNRKEGSSSEWPLFMPVDEARSKFSPGTKVLVAIGGWGDSAGFDTGAYSDESRATFARNVAAMVEDTGADGVDIDWEYPGGNGEDWKKIPNEARAWQVAAYPKFLAEIRSALGPDKIMSAAVPGLPHDMIAFTPETVPQIMESLDFLNVMAYDLMNRRDNVTKHHTGIEASLTAVRAYIDNGAEPDKVNLGFAFYAKYFRTEHEPCVDNPIGCPTGLLEDPVTGEDLGRAGAFAWRDEVPYEVQASFERARTKGKYDQRGGGWYYWDEEESIWWTYDTPEVVAKKFPLIMEQENLGGVFAWGLGEDAPKWAHLRALNAGVRRLASSKEEL
ncbi:glycoside hydrolase family 18 protein [Hypoxylon rubiginosum]|uniref:Glycoside hydrolase family 18 protein n=1 Tax=Hypoxylon rubiginosum TaxID=110542 RepID=A0ACC0CP99_9PEZI|nr:glycoside hydrolase family 18 protein [Hypoxylon rubiginosum]